MRVLELVDRWSTTRNLVLVFVSFLVVVMTMSMLIQTWVSDVYGDVTMPDSRFLYTSSEISNVFSQLGKEGLVVWAQAHMLDFLFPMTYMFGLAFGINMEIRRVLPDNAHAKKLVFFPLFAGLVDYVENILILTQIASYPSLSDPIIMIASAVTAVKWTTLMVGFGVLFVLIPVVLYRRYSGSR